MPKPVPIKAQKSTLVSPFTNVRWASFRPVYATPVADITGKDEEKGGYRNARFDAALPTTELIATGYLFGVGTRSQPKSQKATVQQLRASNPMRQLKIYPWRWTFAKEWSTPADLAGVGVLNDRSRYSGKSWDWGVPVFSYTIVGWVTAGGPDLGSQDVSKVQFNFDTFGSCIGDMKVERYEAAYETQQGGFVWASIEGRMTGEVRYMPGPVDLAHTFAESSPLKGNCQIQCPGGANLPPKMGRATAYSVTMLGDRRQGGPVPLTVKFRFGEHSDHN